jgi:LPS-assembly protein
VTKLGNWIYGAALATVMAAQPLSAFAQAGTSVEQDERVILEADYVFENDEENTVIAEGNVEAMYQGRILRADRLTYNKITDKVRAAGNVVIIDTDGSQQFADEIEVDSDLADGYAIGFSARLPEGATVVANSAVRQEGGVNALDQVIYTSCEVCEEDTTPTWALRARKAVLDQESQMISYRDAVLEVAGLPVFYFPYLAHPDPTSERRSGLLIPSVGVSSKLGAYYQQPYYWAINDSSDLTIAPLLSTNVNPMLELDYRKRFYSGAIDINTSVTYESEFNSDGDLIGDKSWRSHIFAKGLFAITPEWQWGFGLERQSDDLYDRRYSIAGQGSRRGLYKNQPRRLLSQLFVVGQGENYYTDASLLSFQGLRAGDENSQLPLVAPVFFGEKYWDFGNLGFASINASATGITRDEGFDSQRVSLGAEWSDLNVLPGGFTAEPFAEIRGDYYGLDETLSGEDNVTRAVGNAGIRVAYPMVRPGKTVDIMVEPTVMAAWGFSNVNDPSLPNEDSLLYEFDESTLFEGNAFSNYDLYEGDSKLSAGISTRAVWKGGTEISASIGKRWRGRPDEAFSVASNLDGTSSDWVATASADLGKALRIDTRMRLDDDGFNLNRIDARLSSTYKRVRAVGQYYKIDERISPTGQPDEGIYLRGEVRVTDRYSVIFGQLRDITEGLNARSELGIAYEDHCSRFELVYTRSELNDRTLGPSENFQFRFSLKTLGDFGSSEFD